MKTPLLTFMLAILFIPVLGQDLPVYDYPAFEKDIESRDDAIYVYNFWATWCRPCVKELPYFEKLNAEYADRGVKVVLVSLDFPNQVETALLPFIKKKEIKSEVILMDDPDFGSWIDKVSPQWSGAIPATLVYAPGEGIRDFREQTFTYESLSGWIDQLLAQRKNH